jgi:hypothetical protein
LALFGFLAFSCKDASGATNPYLEAGIPAADREWSGDDYQRAAEVLGSGKVPLPRLSDECGKRLLERITSVENFGLDRNKKISLKVRMADYLEIQQGTLAIFSLYSNTLSKDVHSELARLSAFMLQTAGVGMDLMGEFAPTIPKDENYASRMKGLKRMYSGTTTMFSGAEGSLSERHFYSPEDLSVLLNAMTQSLPHMKPAFSMDYRVELRKKLESHRSEFKDKEDAARIETMIAELER